MSVVFIWVMFNNFCLKSLQNLKQTVSKESESATKKAYDASSKGSYGYGGKFGVQTDRMDKVCSLFFRFNYKQGSDWVVINCFQNALGHDYIGTTEKHASQKDYSTGFGGKYGVQKERVDKVRWCFAKLVISHR